jgi:hypothetical protein
MDTKNPLPSVAAKTFLPVASNATTDNNKWAMLRELP